MTAQPVARDASQDTRRRRPDRVRRVPTPALAPPYDDERSDLDAGGYQPGCSCERADAGRLPAGTRGALALALPLAAPVSAVPRLRLAPGPPSAPSAAATTLPPPAAWSARFVRVLLEALAGLRPISQLGAWATADVCRLLARRVGAADRCRDLPRSTGSLHSIHLSTPADAVAEVCAVVQVGGRIRALALRAEAQNGQWRCTDLKVG